MYLLYLLRHAKAAWPEPGMRDFDRPLTASGKADAEALGRVMRHHGHRPVLAYCSAALRARQTWTAVSKNLGGDAVRTVFSDALYNADAAGYLSLVGQTSGDGAILVVGHNPIMEDLALALARNGAPDATRRAAAGFPAGGLAVLSFEVPFGAIAPRSGYLEAFLGPQAH